MAAYIIAEIEIHDFETYESYKKLTPGSLEAFEGKFVIRGGKTEVLEGEWNPNRLVVIEFPSVENARSWWNSEMYAEAKAIRQKAAYTQMIVVEGV
jgi:uncharacterized protein (DUF1330 family)